MNTWLKGIIAAIIGGAATAVPAAIGAPEIFNFSTGLTKLATAAAIGAILAVSAYLAKSPIWNNDQSSN